MNEPDKPADLATQSSSSSMPASRYAAYVILTATGLAADLATKTWVFSWPGRLGDIYWVVPGYFGFQSSLNEGALFGVGQGAVGFFAAISVLAAVVIPVWLFVFRAAHDWWMTVTLGIVTGGVLGNLYDRLGLPGLRWGPPDPRAGETIYAVRDWILFQASDEWRWPNFNIADSLLVAGAILLFLRAWLEPNHEPLESEEANASGTA